jgi:membrane fusion protein, multidrug efflux system
MNRSGSYLTSGLRTFPIAVLAAFLLSGCKPNAPATNAVSPPNVNATPALARTVQLWDNFNGRVEAVQYVSIVPRVSGYIDKINFQEGQLVKAGEVLFTIDSREYAARLQQAVAQLTRARAQAELAQNDAHRAQRLNEVHAVSKEIWEQRQAAAQQAQADLINAQASVTLAKLNLEWTQIRSPVEGRASRAQFTVGNLVNAGDSTNPLTTVISEGPVYVYFDADEALYRRYAAKASSSGTLPVQASLTGEEGYPHKGSVSFVDNQVSRNTGTIKLRATLNNSDHVLMPGQFVRVQLQGSSAAEAVLIDDNAVLTDQDRKYVYVVDDQGVVQRRDVQLSGLSGNLRIVSSGLAAGENVIFNGMQRIFGPGTKVNVQPPEAQSPQKTTQKWSLH